MLPQLKIGLLSYPKFLGKKGTADEVRGDSPSLLWGNKEESTSLYPPEKKCHTRVRVRASISRH